MKTIYTLFTVVLLCTTSLIGQTKQIQKLIANTKDLATRPLKVVYKKETKESNLLYNTMLKEAIESEWTINDDISFITYEEFRTLYKDENSTYAFLRQENGSTHSSSMFSSNGGTAKVNSGSGETRYETSNKFSNLDLIGFNSDGKKISVYPMDFKLDENSDKAEYYILIQDFQNRLTAFLNTPSNTKKMKMKEAKALMAKALLEQKENIKKLESKVLYINEKSLSEKNKENFKDFYKYDYKIVTKEEIYKAVIDNDDNIVILYSDSIKTANTGQQLVFFNDMKNMSGISFGSPNGNVFDIFSKEISKKDLENLKKILK